MATLHTPCLFCQASLGTNLPVYLESQGANLKDQLSLWDHVKCPPRAMQAKEALMKR